jgi:hypothetical protein
MLIPSLLMVARSDLYVFPVPQVTNSMINMTHELRQIRPLLINKFTASNN